MKKVFVLSILFFISGLSISQIAETDYSLRYKTIIELLNKLDYYTAIKDIDIFLKKYPYDGGMYYNRGISNYYLNDIYSARKDLIMAKKLGVDTKDNFINYVTSKSYMVKKFTESYLSDTQIDSVNGYKPFFGLKDSLQGALRPERTCFDVYFYDLTIKILPKSKSIEGSNDIYFKTINKTNKIQIDLSLNFQINSINWKGKELTYKRVYNAIFIEFDEELQTNEIQQISIKYSGKPRIAPNPPWNGGFVWKKKKGKHWIGVACEHLGASSWWPVKDHLTDKPDSMRINVQVPKGYQGIANGNLRSKKVIEGKYTNFEWFVSYPINSYNVTVYMGNFVNFNEIYKNEKDSFPIDYYVLPHNLEKAKKYYTQTKDIVEIYEKLYGEYPYKKDGMAMVEAPFIGMEHQSAIAIGDEYGEKKRRNYTNKDYDYLVVHETAHEWWGNTVAMGDMADAWISEGFATFSEHLFMEKKFGYEEYNSAIAKNMQLIYNIWPMVGKRDVNDNTFLSGDIYHKGAAMLNNLRCTIDNDSLFFLIIKGFYDRYKYKIATSNDFVNIVNELTGNDYTDFFNKFFYDTDPPVLKYHFTLENNVLKFTYQWVNVGENFTMPLSITVNLNKNFRLVGTTKPQTFNDENIKSFYLPNERRFLADQITKNSFTYYWTHWEQ